MGLFLFLFCQEKSNKKLFYQEKRNINAREGKRFTNLTLYQ